jgi:hypothetical protein
MRTSFPIAFAASLLLASGCNEPEVVMNNAPSADAGDAITQAADRKVQLDGRASYDKDGDSLTYYWTFDHLPSNSQLGEMTSPFTVNQTNEGSTTFQPDAVGTYIVKLEVYDGSLYSDASYLVVNATEPENAPVANAGGDIELQVGNVATLDGSQSSDPLGGGLSYQWSLVEVPTNSSLTESALVDADQLNATLSGDVIGWYTATLVVHNGLSYSSPDSVRVHFTGENVAPTADAGGDIDDMDCQDIQLDCSASTDPEGEALSYWWILQSKPENSQIDNRYISGQHIANPTFWADVAGAYTMSCSVFDGTSWSHPDTITLNVAERDYNTPPSVNAGADQEVDAGDVDCTSTTSPYYPYNTTWNCDSCENQTTTIGVSTADADGDPYVVEWIVDEDTRHATLVGVDRVPATVVLDPATPTRGGSCKEVDADFTLAATDCTGATTEDDVSVSIECCGVTK